ncbi:MAG: peptidase M28 [Robiginitomaculum sp.]|nr:MAG: peptidase M28 [Robiginitomaculum sp.]
MSLAKSFLFATSTLALLACTPPAPKADTSVAPSISAADIGRRIERLASDDFEGRDPGTKGGRLASQYIADEMKAAGLVPMGKDGSYFQPITLTKTTVADGSFMKISSADGTATDYDDQNNAVFWTKRYQDSVSINNSELVFVGYGVVAPEYNWDDYAGIDVKGKTVVMFVNDPGFATKDKDLFKGNAMTYYGRWTYKFEEAARQGVAGVIIVHETAPASYGWSVISGGWGGSQIDLVRPDKGASRAGLESWISLDSSKALFARAGLDFDEMKTAAAVQGFKPRMMNGLSMNAQINNTIETIQSRNVAGAVKGTKYPDEYVMYMAHWDHLGMKDVPEGEDGIYNGAVDNATGTATIIEIGEAFAQKPAERSIIVVAVTAEESGLLGSAYYSEDPLVPLHKTVAGLNIDAIKPVGRTKDMMVVGFGVSDLDDILAEIINPKGMYVAPDDKPEAGYYYRSDHISLAKKGVPMLYTHGGVDHEINGKSYGEAMNAEYTKERYHAPSDEYDHTWDISGIEQTGQIFYELGSHIANSRTWPNWYEGTEFRGLRDEMLKKNH